jgi:hypothetical protein
MYLALCEQWRVLKPGGIVSHIVANSRHYYLPVATDVILSEIARCIGFELLDLIVLRKRNGRTRQQLFLRESVVFVRKPTVITENSGIPPSDEVDSVGTPADTHRSSRERVSVVASSVR